MLSDKRQARLAHLMQLQGMHMLSISRVCEAYAAAIKKGHRMTAAEMERIGASIQRGAYRSDRVAMLVEE